MSHGDEFNQHGHEPSHSPPPRSGGGIPGWVFWLGGLLIFNALSYFLGWGWVLF